MVVSIKTFFPNYQEEVKNILIEKNRNIEKQLEKRRQRKWKKLITQTLVIMCRKKTQVKISNKDYLNH